MSLLACPFCRELFPRDERRACPVCGMDLVAAAKLPLSDDALSEDGVTRQPEWDLLPITYIRRGRGPLALLAIAGLIAFFLPWIQETMPDIISFSGFTLARKLGWAWGAGVGWFVLFPIVLTRRTIMHMRGARVAVCFLAAVPGVTAAMLLAHTPHPRYGIPLRFSFDTGLFATIALSFAAVAVGLFFGGRVDDIAVRRGTSAGQTVH
jgi:hypothetical protein